MFIITSQISERIVRLTLKRKSSIQHQSIASTFRLDVTDLCPFIIGYIKIHPYKNGEYTVLFYLTTISQSKQPTLEGPEDSFRTSYNKRNTLRQISSSCTLFFQQFIVLLVSYYYFIEL